MLKCNNYVFAQSLQEAYELNQKRNNVIVAGNGWLRLGNKQWSTAIDISELGLNTVEEDEKRFTIGAMTALRDLEKNEGLNKYTNNAIKEALRSIVGTQFRNTVTVGGSIFGRFGFSDVLTVFLAMETYVQLYKGGIVPLNEFVKMPYDNDILVNIIVEKTPIKISYLSFRNQSTDFPVLTCGVSIGDDGVRAAIGARPHKAYAVFDKGEIIKNDRSEEAVKKYSKWIVDQFEFGTNMRGSGEYRKHIACVLVERAVRDIIEEV